jgi:hypothetical protein
MAAMPGVSADGDPSLALYPNDDKSSITVGYTFGGPKIRLMDKDGTVVWGHQ